MLTTNKIVTLNDLDTLKKDQPKKIIGLCHGAFDILHFGHLLHFQEAKDQCDVLVVSVTEDKYITKNPAGTYHNISQRLNMLANHLLVDFVVASPFPTGTDVINRLKPHKYFKGIDYANLDNKDLALANEKEACEAHGGKIVFTRTEKLSSTFILNNLLDDKRKAVRNYLDEHNLISEMDYIEEIHASLSKIDAMIFGETIIDQYTFGNLTGLSSKYTAASFLQRNSLQMIGGTGALASIARTHLRTAYLPAPNLAEEELAIEPCETLKVFNVQMPLVTKTRFISERKRERLFEAVEIKQGEGETDLSEVEALLRSQPNLPVIAFDFGHGLFDHIDIDAHAQDRFLAMNVQANSTNYPYNDVSKYTNYSLLTLDERELRLTMRDGESPVESLIREFLKRQTTTTDKYYFFTLGPHGAWGAHNEQLFHCPALVKGVVDATGSGDIFHMMAACLSIIGTALPKTLLISSLYAGLYAQIEGHSDELGKENILKAFKSLG